MTLGLSTWCVAIVWSAMTDQYSGLLLGRLLSGVAEASFAGLAPTVIDDIASKQYRTSWLSLFYACLPVGGAVGYVSGGVFATSSWRAGFFTEAVLMIPCIVVLYYIKPTNVPNNKLSTEQSSDDTQLYQRAVSVPTRYTSQSLSTSTLYQPIQMKHDIDVDNIKSVDQLESHTQTSSADDMLLPLSAAVTNDSSKSKHHKTVKWSLPSASPASSTRQSRMTIRPSLIRVSSAPMSKIDYSENEFLTDVLILVSEPVYLCIVLGMSALTFVIGAMRYVHANHCICYTQLLTNVCIL